MAIIARRVRQDVGACTLPEGDARGGWVQMVHRLLVALSRTYLEDLTANVVDSWLNPDGLPPELRAVPPAGDAAVDGVDTAGDYGDLVGYGEIVQAPPVAAATTGGEDPVVNLEPFRAPVTADRDVAATSGAASSWEDVRARLPFSATFWPNPSGARHFSGDCCCCGGGLYNGD